ncbi:hypothetical protein Purlil1_13459 [Purpureocillium lilacinum]|uniref:Uncharacterized protein n=1 Tax=Purpureocillium lilacinum TaxID=33203 RepID=A0ABR0BDY0_PURLI|nr:hypothetical protein Purlil1_13459 [Purpureocillium lilacinum]
MATVAYTEICPHRLAHLADFRVFGSPGCYDKNLGIWTIVEGDVGPDECNGLNGDDVRSLSVVDINKGCTLSFFADENCTIGRASVLEKQCANSEGSSFKVLVRAFKRGSKNGMQFQCTDTFPPSFYFDRDRYHARDPATESNTPSLTYMNFDTPQHARRQYFYRRASRSPFYDSSKKRVRVPFPGFSKMLRQLQPKNVMENLCVMAVLIALAQEQHWAQKQRSGSPVLSASHGTGCVSESNPLGTAPASDRTWCLSSSFRAFAVPSDVPAAGVARPPIASVRVVLTAN